MVAELPYQVAALVGTRLRRMELPARSTAVVTLPSDATAVELAAVVITAGDPRAHIPLVALVAAVARLARVSRVELPGSALVPP